MKCLYCKKGIGPIRQLRDLEFCSEAHRNQFRDRYREQVYAALAPEPAPTRTADFIEQGPPAAGPVPRAVLGLLAKSLPRECQPAMRVAAAGISLDWPSWILLQDLAAMPTRLVWQDAAAGYPCSPPAVTNALLSMDVQHPHNSFAGASPANLVAGTGAARPPATAVLASESSRSLPAAAALPGVPATGAPAKAEASAPQLHAAIPASAHASVAGPAAPAPRAIATLSSSPAIATPAAPAGPAIACEPRPLEAGPLLTHGDLRSAVHQGVPVAFEVHGIRAIAVILPKPPATAECGVWMALSQHVQSFRPDLRRLPARLRQALSLPAPLPSSDHRALALAPMASIADPQLSAPRLASPSSHNAPLSLPARNVSPPGEPCTAWIGPRAPFAETQSRPLGEADGDRNLRSAGMAPARVDPLSVHCRPSTAPAAPQGIVDCAPLHHADAPAPALPPTALPSWDAARAVPQDQPLAPRPDIELPRIDGLPAPAGAVGGPGLPVRPDMGRSVRSCAVLWTLRVIRTCLPTFGMLPVWAKFEDLVRAERSLPFMPEPQEARPPKTNLRVIKRARGARTIGAKLGYLAVAAAALLLAGVLRPQAAPKSAGWLLQWRGASIRQWVTQRATRDFADDFRGGLNQWKGVQAKWPRTWSYSRDGFMHPGQLALYRPSVPLSDYRFEFMAQIESKSVDWVVRARDADNYYALKFTVVEPGPRPIVAMVRYPVVGGIKGPRVQTPVRMMIHANTPYRVSVEVKGNRYRAYIEGQEADFWVEDRLKTGGVGFFSEAGERARVYWVKLESQGDILGRICGLLTGNSGESQTEKEKQAMDYRHAETTDTKAASGLSGADAATTAQEARISHVLSKAASLHLDGKLDEAAGELARALEGGERHPALYFALGQLQYEMQDYGPASQSYTQAALLQPLHPTAHFNAGVCLGRVERWEDAAAAFRKAISNDPSRNEAHLALGACLVQMGLHNEALDAYDRFLSHHPDHDEALFGKAVALQKRDRSGEAVELYRRILNRNPNSEEALSNLVSLSLANQDYAQAQKYAQRLVEAQPRSQIALEGLAGAAFAAGDNKAAAGYSRKLAEVAPQVFENWFNLGVACHKAGDLPGAAEAYARATRVQPDSPQAHLNLGVAMQEQGDLKAARAAYERALEVDPQLPGVHWNLGLVHEQLDDAAAAERLYAQVPENSADSDDAAFRIGHLRLQRADYPGSIQAFEACLEKRPNWPEARLNLGIAHWRANDKEAARVCFQELTASGSDSKEALRGLAALSLEHEDYDKAFEIYRQLLDGGERTPELLYNTALICQRRGQPEDAAVLYKEAIKADPGFGEALLNLGHALMSLGNEFEARSCWRKAVIAKPELAQRYFEPVAQAS